MSLNNNPRYSLEHHHRSHHLTLIRGRFSVPPIFQFTQYYKAYQNQAEIRPCSRTMSSARYVPGALANSDEQYEQYDDGRGTGGTSNQENHSARGGEGGSNRAQLMVSVEASACLRGTESRS